MKKAIVLAVLLMVGTAFADTVSTTGTFSNPTPTCPPATCNGIGTNFVDWGGPPTPSSLLFTGASGAYTPGVAYQLGTILYTNGATFETALTNVDLNMTSSFSGGGDSLLNLSFGIVTTPNLGVDPNADADFLTVFGFPQSFHVLEGQSATIELWAKDGQFIGFQNPGNGGFVPEPSTLLLFGTGFAGLISRMRKVRR